MRIRGLSWTFPIQHGGPGRILRRHRPMPNGLCSGRLSRPNMYPCQAAPIALLTEQHPEYRAENVSMNTRIRM
jgi:hypothetical protein